MRLPLVFFLLLALTPSLAVAQSMPAPATTTTSGSGSQEAYEPSGPQLAGGALGALGGGIVGGVLVARNCKPRATQAGNGLNCVYYGVIAVGAGALVGGLVGFGLGTLVEPGESVDRPRSSSGRTVQPGRTNAAVTFSF